jgi:hypothetical protein
VSDAWRSFASPEWPAFAGADWLTRVMTVDVPDRRHAKQGRDIGRWTLTRGGETLVVYLKRHFELPPRGPSPGWQEFESLAWAAAQGVPVPTVHAAGETTRGPRQSFLAVEELTGMLALHELVPLAQVTLPPAAFARWKRGLTREVARLTRELHRRRAYHQDLYLCHFYARVSDITTSPDSRDEKSGEVSVSATTAGEKFDDAVVSSSGWVGRVVMIDFHRLARSPWRGRWFQVKDVAQLLFSTAGVRGLTARDAVRFWRAYRRADGRDWKRQPGWVARLARWKSANYLRHNRKLVAGVPA